MSTKIPRINFFTFVSRSREKGWKTQKCQKLFFLKKGGWIPNLVSAAERPTGVKIHLQLIVQTFLLPEVDS